MKRLHLAAFLMNATVAIGLAGLGVHEVKAESERRIAMATSIDNQVQKVNIEKQTDCLAKNIYFEARNQSFLGQRAVAWVTLNRVKDEQYPKSVCEVVWQDGQFSWTEDGKSDKPNDETSWMLAQFVAEIAMYSYGQIPDPTNGATMYHADYVDPYWSSKFVETVEIEDHIFYKDEKKGS
jgi:spore germination cell wall hydrolase CwlJ-like protein